MDLITLSMPVYNVEKYVERALLSALNQTYKSIEFIIVDDRGSDKSMEIVRRIISGHPRGKQVRIIEHERNIGLGAGRNTAIENALGKYLFFMDSDDEISLDCIDRLYAKMQEEDVDFVEGSVRRLKRSGEIIEDSICTVPTLKGYLEVAQQIYEKRNYSSQVTTWNKLYRLSFLRDNRILCNPTHLNEDVIFSFQLFLNVHSRSSIPDITYFYYDTPGSLENQNKGNKGSSRICRQYAEICSFYREYTQNYHKENLYESILQYVVNYECFLAIRISDNAVITKSEKKKFIKTATIFPVSFKEIAKLKKKKLFFYIMQFVFKMPFKVSLFKLILWISDRKKKITKKMICRTRQGKCIFFCLSFVKNLFH
ncbi:MAG: glycosyltransferase [Prevotellaceae bacterium]|jgi:glycosyltransferase involved in cell wall biosynthesis|nr:glycosyltransferase [Prevotellaceae bacterium]